ncbi:MAG: ParB N-terminal domain-containing protein [Acaryochloridaceae cyanobacterium RU_4_10]|nr:ParB N-terminal domain-containing protein [Acaryochloridaceae cyanobacterium RU_4_10]
MGNVGNSLKAGFLGVKENQEIISLKAQIQTLQNELALAKSGVLTDSQEEALSRQLEGLTDTLGKQRGIHDVKISLIDRDNEQPRTVFPPLLIQERMESLRRHGQKTPVILIPQESGRYKIFDGELRYRSAKKLQWKTLKSVFLPDDEVSEDNSIFESQVITSIHAQRLHDLDLAFALVKLVTHDYPHFEGQQDRIPTLLNTALRRLEREGKSLLLSDIRLEDPTKQKIWLDDAGFKELEEYHLFEVILRLQLNPLSINSNVFPLLKLEDELKDVVRTDGLESSKARELNKLSASKLKVSEEEAIAIRRVLTKKVVDEKLSLKETKELILEQLQKGGSRDRLTKGNKIIKDINSLDISSISNKNELLELKKALKIKMDELNKLLKMN